MFQRHVQSGISALLFALPAAFLPIAAPGQAQSPAPAAPPASSTQSSSVPTITANSDEVSLDLVVRTKSGKPILDLKPSDLAVTDNGAPVKLTGLHLVKGASESQRLITVFFDRLDPGRAKYARQLATKILGVIPDEGYSYAVLQMNGRLRLIQAFTTSRETLTQAMTTATSPAANDKPTADLSPAEKELIETTQSDALSTDFADRARARLLLAALEDSQRTLEDHHEFPSLYALQALAMSQKQITGRKIILYFSSGLAASNDIRDTIRDVVAQANRAGVTVVVIDTDPYNRQSGDAMMVGAAMNSMAMSPGAVEGAAMKASGLAVYGSVGISGGNISLPSPKVIGSGGTTPWGVIENMGDNMIDNEFNSLEDARTPLGILARGTGGVYLQAGASLRIPLRALHDDLTSYYEASYAPNIRDYNGAFRPVAIHPLRKGIVVQSRAGYFALPPENGSGIRPFEVPLLSILAQPALPTDIGFHAGVLALGKTPDGNTDSLAVQVPVSQLQVHEDGNTRLSTIHLTIVAQIRNEKGALVQRFSEDIPRHEAPESLRAPGGQFITMQRHFSADPGTYTLETAAFDRIGNKAGAQRTTFTVAPLPQGPSLSDVALVRTVEPIHADTASFEPMHYMDGRIVPDLFGELPEATRNLSVFFLVHPLPALAGTPQLSMQIFRNGTSVGEIPLALSKTDGLGAVPYLGTIGAHVFPPGNYKIEAKLTQGGQTTVSEVAFSVEGTIAATMASSDEAFSATAGSAADAAARTADESATAAAATAHSKFVITAAKDPVPPPTAEEAGEMIEAARKRALAWSDMLPNFLCAEITDHSIDPEGDGDWRHKDHAVQIMRYVDHRESRSTLELNGQRNIVNNAGAALPLPSELDFAHSIGEFGGMFQLVFDPSAHAKFSWQESDVLDGEPVQVFAYQVDLAHSNFSLAGVNMQQLPVAFHGIVYLDIATHSIRRITVDADNIPDTLKVRATSISVDYNWVTIAGHDYLMPSRGAVSLREGKHEAILNEFEFRNYRRFGSQIRVLSTAESKKLAPN